MFRVLWAVALWAAVLAAVLAVAPTGAVAQDGAREEAVFDITLLGLRAATLTFAGTVEGGQYAASGHLHSTGIARMVANVRFDAQVRGVIRSGRFQPRHYTERAVMPDRSAAGTVRYVGRTPQDKVYIPPRDTDPDAVPAKTQAGTVDPMTVIFAALRDQPREKLCSLSYQVYDGARRSQVTLSNPSAENSRGQLTCQGEYRRIAGFSAKAMAERQRFPFQMTYQRQPDGVYRVILVQTPTTFGQATLRRR